MIHSLQHPRIKARHVPVLPVFLCLTFQAMTGAEVLSSLALQMLMYFNTLYSPVWLLLIAFTTFEPEVLAGCQGSLVSRQLMATWCAVSLSLFRHNWHHPLPYADTAGGHSALPRPSRQLGRKLAIVDQLLDSQRSL